MDRRKRWMEYLQLVTLAIILPSILMHMPIVDGAKGGKIRLKVQATKDVQLMIPTAIDSDIRSLIRNVNKRSIKHRLVKKYIENPKEQYVSELYVNDALLFEDDLVGDVLNENDLIVSRWNGVSEQHDVFVSVDADGTMESEEELAPPPPKEEMYKVNMGRGLIIDVNTKPNGYVSDLAESIMTSVEGQLASSRTAIVELQVDGATLFPDDITNRLINPANDVVDVVWGFSYTIKATDTVMYPVALYHNAKIRNLVYAARNLALQHNKLKDRKDVIVDLRLSNGMTLFEYYNDLVTARLTEADEILHAVWGNVYFVHPNIQTEKVKHTDNPTVTSNDVLDHLVVGVSDISYVSTLIQNANIAVSQNSDVYQFATKNKIVDIQLEDGSVLDRNALVVDAVRKGSELYAVWKDMKEIEEEDEYEDFEEDEVSSTPTPRPEQKKKIESKPSKKNNKQMKEKKKRKKKKNKKKKNKKKRSRQ